MPLYSRFAPYGLLRFSSRPSNAELIYNARVTSEGGQAGLSGAHEATVYAETMCIAAADATIELAANQQHPDRASVLLDDLESDWGLPQVYGSTDDWRRDRLALARQIGWGARRSAIVDGLRRILGDDFIAYRTMDTSETSPTPWTSSPGTFKRAGTSNMAIRLSQYIVDLTQPIWIDYEWFAGADDDLMVGDTLAVDPGKWGSAEAVEILALSVHGADTTSLRAQFTRPHDAGTLARTGNCPTWSSMGRHSFVVVEESVLDDAAALKAIHEFMAKSVRGVSTWDIVREESAGTIGPFVVGTGIIAHTSIVEMDSE